MTARWRYDERLRELSQAVLELGTFAEGAVEKALAAFARQDKALAEEVLREDAEASRRQFAIEDQCIQLMATEQPVARDLRGLVAVMRVSSNLERIADHAVHLAEISIRLAGEPYLAAARELERMGELGVRMLHDAMTAFLADDAVEARRVALRDQQVDAMHDVAVQGLLAQMRGRPETVEQATSLVVLARFLERLADHVTSICEWIVYRVEGERARLR